MTSGIMLLKNFSLLQYLGFFLRLLVACACGAAIGIERTKRLKEAGIRTHIIVSCAAALVMIVSKYGFSDTVLANGTFLYGTHGTDPARLAAQVITGISVLGAGIIFHTGSSIRGLTTAAGIWATAGIGLAIGAGLYVVGILATGLIAILQVLMHRYTLGADSMIVGKIRCTVKDPNSFREAFRKYVDEQKMQILATKVAFNDDGSANYEFTLRMGQDTTVSDIAAFLESIGNIRAISCELTK